MVAGVDYGDSFKRDMGYSRAEFFRILPGAVAGFKHDVSGNCITVKSRDKNQKLVMNVASLPDRKIGMISIPRIEVTFAFNNFSEDERKEFLRSFDRSYQRGGG